LIALGVGLLCIAVIVGVISLLRRRSNNNNDDDDDEFDTNGLSTRTHTHTDIEKSLIKSTILAMTQTINQPEFKSVRDPATEYASVNIVQPNTHVSI
jgi:hypothetical protein